MSFKTVLFKLTAEGQGCVNFFGSVGKKKGKNNENGQYMMPKFTGLRGAETFPNFEHFSQEHLEKLGNLYISSQRVKKEIFENLPMGSAFYTLLNGIPLDSKERVLWAFHPIFLLRGYLSLSKKAKEEEEAETEETANIGMARPCSFRVCDLVDSLKNYSLTVDTRDKTTEEKKSNKLRQALKVFETKYTGEIIVDCEKLSWISLSNLMRDSVIDLAEFDFTARKDEVLNYMRESFKTLAVVVDHEIKGDLVSYEKGTETADLANGFSTAGIRMDEEAIEILLKLLSKGIRDFSIIKNSGEATVTCLEVFASEEKNIRMGKQIELDPITLEVK